MIPLIVLDIAGRIADRLIQAPDVSVQKPERVAVQAEAIKELQPVLEHLTNNEPWYRSNVTWGAIFAITGGLTTIGTLWINGVPLSYEAYGTPALAVWGGVQGLWGRWKARKPLPTIGAAFGR